MPVRWVGFLSGYSTALGPKEAIIRNEGINERDATPLTSRFAPAKLRDVQAAVAEQINLHVSRMGGRRLEVWADAQPAGQPLGGRLSSRCDEVAVKIATGPQKTGCCCSS